MTDKDTPESLIEYPCQFPIKVMGIAGDELEIAVLEIFRRHVPDIAEDSIRQRPSSKGTYMALTVTITATSREQLDALYMELTSCEHVKYCL